MRLRITLVCLAVLSVAGFAALSLLRGQERAPTSPAPPPPLAAAPNDRPPSAAPRPRRHDFSKANDLQKDMLLSARRGAEWLFRMNTIKGRFVHGLEPSLPDVVLDGDSYLRQAGAAFALARAAPRPGRRPLHRPRHARRSSPCSTKPSSTRRKQVRCTAAAVGRGQPPRRRRAARPGHQRVARPANRPSRSVRAAVQLHPQTGTAGRLAGLHRPRPGRQARRRNGGDQRLHRRRPVRADAQPDPPARPMEDRPGAQGRRLLSTLVAGAQEHGIRPLAHGRLLGGVPADEGAAVRRLRVRDERLAVRFAVRPVRPAAAAVVRRLQDVGRTARRWRRRRRSAPPSTPRVWPTPAARRGRRWTWTATRATRAPCSSTCNS